MMKTKKTKKATTTTVQKSLTEISSLNNNIQKKWQTKIINFSENILRKITKLPIKISTNKENIMLNACAIFWYQAKDCKKFVMLSSSFDSTEETKQFPFVACLNKESVSATLETSIKDMFGEAFKKSLSIDTFAADKISSAPTVVVANEKDEVQSILHNHVWVVQITPQQADLIQNHSDKYRIINVPEYKLTDESVHEAHKFLYHSCIRHIHNINLTDMAAFAENNVEEMFSFGSSENGRTLH